MLSVDEESLDVVDERREEDEVELRLAPDEADEAVGLPLLEVDDRLRSFAFRTCNFCLCSSSRCCSTVLSSNLEMTIAAAIFFAAVLTTPFGHNTIQRGLWLRLDDISFNVFSTSTR